MSKSFDILRQAMVEKQLARRGITSRRVLQAMQATPRHRFVPLSQQHLAYTDHPLPIGEGQTISQPYVVALMTQALHLKPYETVLEIGTGSGYQTAILCQLAQHVYSLEYFPRLAGRAAQALSLLGYDNVDIHVGDGSQGLADMAPYHAIMVTAAAPALPGPLRSQLHPDGGRMILPVGDRGNQVLKVITRQGDQWSVRQIDQVRFVPLLGRYGFKVSPKKQDQHDKDDWALNF